MIKSIYYNTFYELSIDLKFREVVYEPCVHKISRKYLYSLYI